MGNASPVAGYVTQPSGERKNSNSKSLRQKEGKPASVEGRHGIVPRTVCSAEKKRQRDTLGMIPSLRKYWTKPKTGRRPSGQNTLRSQPPRPTKRINNNTKVFERFFD